MTQAEPFVVNMSSPLFAQVESSVRKSLGKEVGNLTYLEAAQVAASLAVVVAQGLGPDRERKVAQDGQLVTPTGIAMDLRADGAEAFVAGLTQTAGELALPGGEEGIIFNVMRKPTFRERLRGERGPQVATTYRYEPPEFRF